MICHPIFVPQRWSSKNIRCGPTCAFLIISPLACDCDGCQSTISGDTTRRLLLVQVDTNFQLKKIRTFDPPTSATRPARSTAPAPSRAPERASGSPARAGVEKQDRAAGQRGIGDGSPAPRGARARPPSHRRRRPEGTAPDRVPAPR